MTASVKNIFKHGHLRRAKDKLSLSEPNNLNYLPRDHAGKAKVKLNLSRNSCMEYSPSSSGETANSTLPASPRAKINDTHNLGRKKTKPQEQSKNKITTHASMGKSERVYTALIDNDNVELKSPTWNYGDRLFLLETEMQSAKDEMDKAEGKHNAAIESDQRHRSVGDEARKTSRKEERNPSKSSSTRQAPIASRNRTERSMSRSRFEERKITNNRSQSASATHRSSRPRTTLSRDSRSSAGTSNVRDRSRESRQPSKTSEDSSKNMGEIDRLRKEIFSVPKCHLDNLKEEVHMLSKSWAGSAHSREPRQPSRTSEDKSKHMREIQRLCKEIEASFEKNMVKSHSTLCQRGQIASPICSSSARDEVPRLASSKSSYNKDQRPSPTSTALVCAPFIPVASKERTVSSSDWNIGKIVSSGGMSVVSDITTFDARTLHRTRTMNISRANPPPPPKRRNLPQHTSMAPPIPPQSPPPRHCHSSSGWSSSKSSRTPHSFKTMPPPPPPPRPPLRGLIGKASPASNSHHIVLKCENSDTVASSLSSSFSSRSYASCMREPRRTRPETHSTHSRSSSEKRRVRFSRMAKVA